MTPNVLLYVPLVLSLLRRRMRKELQKPRRSFQGPRDGAEAGNPDLPAGFTWDALARLRSAGVQTNGMENALKGYEVYRHGGASLPNVDFHEVVAVANMLGGINTAETVTPTLGQ